MPTNDALQWTRYDAALALMRRLDSYRLLVSTGTVKPYDHDAVIELSEEFDRLTSIERREAAADADFRPTWAYVDVH